MNTQIPQHISDATVFPLRDLAKTPSVNWREHTSGITEYTRTYGVDCARSNLAVIDLDVHDEDANGVDAWRTILEEQGVKDFRTFTVATPNNGLHLYFRADCDEVIKNSASKLASGIDVRGEGGYVVGPNSEVKDVHGVIRRYTVEDDADVQTMPEWLVDRLTAAPARTADTTPRAAEPYEYKFVEAAADNPNYIRKVFESQVADFMNSPGGTRNDALNRAAFNLARTLGPSHEHMIVSELQRANTAIGRPDEDATIYSGVESGLNEYIPKYNGYAQQSETTQSRSGSVSGEHAARNDKKIDKELHHETVAIAERFAKDAAKNGFAAVTFGPNEPWACYNKRKGIWVGYTNEQARKVLQTWARREIQRLVADDVPLNKLKVYQSARSLREILDWSRTSLFEKLEAFDAHPNLIAFANGVYDIDQRELLPHSQEFRLTKRIPHDFDEDASDPRLDAVLQSLPEDAVDWFQEFAGQALIGGQGDFIPFLHADGHNGKSSLLYMLEHSAGGYGLKLDNKVFSKGELASQGSYLKDLKGARTTIVEEVPDRYLNFELIKEFVRGHKITVEPKYMNPYEIVVESNFMISANRLPIVSENTSAVWSRLVVIPFPFTYVNDPNVYADTSMLRKKDPRILEACVKGDRKLTKAFLAWRLRGLNRWLDNDRKLSSTPDSVRTATDAWHTANDNIAAWADDHLELDEEQFCLWDDLYDSYRLWARDSGYSPKNMSNFKAEFESHRFFKNNWLEARNKQRPTKKIRQSKYYAPDKKWRDDYEPRRIGSRGNFVVGVAFA